MKKNNGMTLVALVVSIIVLLILAGVSIAMLTGKNGLITKAISAKEKTEQAETDEKDKLAKTNETIEKYVTNRDGSITIDSNKLNEMIEEKVKEQYTYSTEEKKVGKWIDGKELYRKTFVYDTPTSGNATVLVGNIGEYNTAFIDYSSSFYINTNGDYAGSVPSVQSINCSGRNVDKATYTSYSCIGANGNVIVYYGSTTASSKTVVTVNYTKK